MLNDRVFFPLMLLVAVIMVGGALLVGSGQPACGPMGGADSDQSYRIVTIRGDDLCRIVAGGESEIELFEAEDGRSVVSIEMDGEAQRDAAESSPHFKLGPDLETVYAGQTINITLMARPAARAGAVAFEAKYSTGRAGDSGWRQFYLEPDWQAFTFSYDVPEKLLKQTVALDYLAIRPVAGDKPRGIWIESVTLEVQGQ
ncbi:MAG: hypothetical protein GYB42_08320 [Alphaproteobacteria bacterium]|nr:hypothetical protein [Alphaproteobacteria bacterium]